MFKHNGNIGFGVNTRFQGDLAKVMTDFKIYVTFEFLEGLATKYWV